MLPRPSAANQRCREGRTAVLRPSEINQHTVVERFSETLKARAPETNRKGWIWQLATEISRSDDTIERRLRGEGESGITDFLALCAYFRSLGDNGFINEILELAGYAAAPLDALGKVANANRLVELEDAIAKIGETTAQLNVDRKASER